MPKTVLDLGAYNGRASKGLVEPGDRWILVDNQQYKNYDGWQLIESVEGAEYIICDIMDYHEPADIVVCSNVLYHVPDPWKFLKHLRKLTKEKLILTTYYDGQETAEWHLYDPDKNPAHSHAPTARTIFYRPTIVGLLESLQSAGFTDIKVVHRADIVRVEAT